jgi:TetR/AcrR family transcriptional regulator, cholesterol catabolism regulator
MTTLRNTRDDVVRAAGRLFADKGYHGTSMRDLGRELGLHGSSLYSHISSKEDLLVDVVMRGADLFEAAARSAVAEAADPPTRLEALVAAHVAVVLDHIDESRTFLNEARALEDEHRGRVVEARDRYEAVFRQVLTDGVAQGHFRPDLDVRMSAIYILSILNAVDRWYRVDGELDRPALVKSLMRFVLDGIAGDRRADRG